MAEKLSKEIENFLNVQKLGYVATVSSNNTPNLSPKGTIIAWDENNLAFADIRSPNTIKNLEENPNLEINVVDPLLRKGYRFSGKGSIIREGDDFEAILQKYRENGIKSEINAIVLVKVGKISEVTSPLYDLGISESEIKQKWKKHFNDL